MGPAPLPLPIAQRLAEIVPSYRALQLALAEIGAEDYRDALHSRDPAARKNIAYTLERTFEVVINLVDELVALALRDMQAPRADARRNLIAFAAEGAIAARLSEQLTALHLTRNDLQYAYPGLRASTVYPACEQLARILPTFLRALQPLAASARLSGSGRLTARPFPCVSRAR